MILHLPSPGSVLRPRLNPCPLSLQRPAVGSRTGAPTLGSGGCSTAFAVALHSGAIITFPAPATSNVACGFPALRSPVCFGLWLMGPIRPSRLSAEQNVCLLDR